MSRKLPPLNSLRAFEAAARHLSFTRAADELFVTQAAISHQVKSLEEYLGLQLFKRLNRALMLTDEGQKYFPEVRDALDQLSNATENLIANENTGILTVSVMPSFASLWLVSRLHHFYQEYPDIDVRISAEDRLTDFSRDDVDCAIRYGRGGWTDVYWEKFMEEEIFPVCSPHYLEKHPAIKDPSGLAGHQLLHDYAVRPIEDDHLTWRNWLTKAGATNVDYRRGPQFSHTHMVMQACIAGEGVAMGRSALIQQELATGRLVRLYKFAVTSDVAYYFVCPKRGIERYKNSAFRDWLLSESGN